MLDPEADGNGTGRREDVGGPDSEADTTTAAGAFPRSTDVVDEDDPSPAMDGRGPIPPPEEEDAYDGK